MVQTSFMQEYLQAMHQDIDDAIDEARRSRDPHRKDIIGSRGILRKMIDLAFEHEEEIVVSRRTMGFIDEWIGEHELPQEWLFPAELPEIGIGIIFEELAESKGWPFKVKALQVYELGNRVIERLNINLRESAKEDVKQKYTDIAWDLHVVNDRKVTEFSVRYYAGSRQWKIPEDSQCPFAVCSQKSAYRCKQCIQLKDMIIALFTLILAARRGEFQEIEYRASRKSPESGNNPRMPQGREAPEAIVSRIDVRNRTVYAKEEDSERHEEEPGQHWKALHDEKDVEAISKPAKGHERHYKNGKVVSVKPSKPRVYWRLKGKRVTILD